MTETKTVETAETLAKQAQTAFARAASSAAGQKGQEYGNKFLDYFTDPNNEVQRNKILKFASYASAMTGNTKIKFVTDLAQGAARLDINDFRENGITRKNAGPAVQGLVDTGLNNIALRLANKFIPNPQMAGYGF